MLELFFNVLLQSSTHCSFLYSILTNHPIDEEVTLREYLLDSESSYFKNKVVFETNESIVWIELALQFESYDYYYDQVVSLQAELLNRGEKTIQKRVEYFVITDHSDSIGNYHYTNGEESPSPVAYIVDIKNYQENTEKQKLFGFFKDPNKYKVQNPSRHLFNFISNYKFINMIIKQSIKRTYDCMDTETRMLLDAHHVETEEELQKRYPSLLSKHVKEAFEEAREPQPKKLKVDPTLSITEAIKLCIDFQRKNCDLSTYPKFVESIMDCCTSNSTSDKIISEISILKYNQLVDEIQKPNTSEDDTSDKSKKMTDLEQKIYMIETKYPELKDDVDNYLDQLLENKIEKNCKRESEEINKSTQKRVTRSQSLKKDKNCERTAGSHNDINCTKKGKSKRRVLAILNK